MGWLGLCFYCFGCFFGPFLWGLVWFGVCLGLLLGLGLAQTDIQKAEKFDAWFKFPCTAFAFVAINYYMFMIF